MCCRILFIEIFVHIETFTVEYYLQHDALYKLPYSDYEVHILYVSFAGSKLNSLLRYDHTTCRINWKAFTKQSTAHMYT